METDAAGWCPGGEEKDGGGEREGEKMEREQQRKRETE